MNGLSILGQKAEQSLQIEIELKLEFKNYKLHLHILPVRHDQTFPWDFSACKFRALVQCVNNTIK